MTLSLIKPGPIPNDSRVYEFFGRLWSQREWIHRRVDSVKLISNDTLSCYYTFDISAEFLHEIANDCNISIDRRIPLPLFTHRTSPILDINVKLKGEPQSLAGRSTISQITQAIFFYEYSKLEETNLSALDPIFDELSNITFAFIRDGIDEFDELDEKIQLLLRSAIYNTPIKIHEIAKAMEISIEFKRFVRAFRSRNSLIGIPDRHYLVAAFVDPLLPNFSAKLQIATQVPYSTPFRKSIQPLRSPVLRVEGGTLDTAFENRYHVKIDIPYELWVREIWTAEWNLPKHKFSNLFQFHRRVRFLTTGVPFDFRENGTSLGSEQFKWRISSTRSAIEVHDTSAKDNTDTSKVRDLQIRLGVRFHVFHLKAALILGFILAFALSTLIGQAADNQMGNLTANASMASEGISSLRLKEGSDSNPDSSMYLTITIGIVAAILAFPTLFGNSSEDRFVRSLLLRYRVLFSISAVSSLSLSLLHIFAPDLGPSASLHIDSGILRWLNGINLLSGIAIAIPSISIVGIFVFGALYRRSIAKYHLINASCTIFRSLNSAYFRFLKTPVLVFSKFTLRVLLAGFIRWFPVKLAIRITCGWSFILEYYRKFG